MQLCWQACDIKGVKDETSFKMHRVHLLTPISCMYKKVSYSDGGYLRTDGETFHCAASNGFA
jgi:hypothetical protein